EAFSPGSAPQFQSRTLEFLCTKHIMKPNLEASLSAHGVPGLCSAKPDQAAQCPRCRTPLPGSSSQETMNEASASGNWSVEISETAAAEVAAGDLKRVYEQLH